MTIDAAIISYYNMVRTQRLVGDLSLVVERDLFGQEPLNQFHGPTVGNRLEEQLAVWPRSCCLFKNVRRG